jgi:hypothetical protein
MTMIDGKPYSKVDLHVHTAETSKCGIVAAADLVTAYKAAGYDGFTITDHLHEGYVSLQTAGMTGRMHHALSLWISRAKRLGDEIGFTVALGIELRFPESESDYLLYGVDEAFLRANPYLTSHGSRVVLSKIWRSNPDHASAPVSQ